MYSLLESKVEIARAQRKLESVIRQSFKSKKKTNIGYPGGTERNATVMTDGSHWFWSADQRVGRTASHRRLNWFGLMPQAIRSRVDISVEINTPFEGKNNHVGGFFGRDNDSGQIYLFHSARVGGGTKGVSREPFLTWSGHSLVEVFDASGKPREGVLVMPIQGLGAVRSAVRYVDSIASFKLAVRAGETSTKNFRTRQSRLHAFYAESHGRRRGWRSTSIDYVSRHGEVVQALHDWRKAAASCVGLRLVKDVFIDLGVATRNGHLVEVYEVKTSADRQSVYTAIGQLFVHGEPASCRRVIVLPEQDKLAPDLVTALQRNGIEVMLYELTEHAANIK